jgi:hypothetical protein
VLCGGRAQVLRDLMRTPTGAERRAAAGARGGRQEKRE